MKKLTCMVFLGFIALLSFAHAEGPAGTLYERLGKKEAITAIVEVFVGNVSADSRINHFFSKTNLSHLKLMLVDQICEAAGGPCKYTGKNMKAAHQGLNIGGADFAAWVDAWVKALAQTKVSGKEKGEILAILAPMQKDILEKK